jgi:HEAT repeat protein
MMSFLQGLFGPPDVEKLKSKRDVKGLIKALGFQNADSIRQSAAQALGEMGDASAIEPLITALITSGTRDAAANALAMIGLPAVEPLITRLSYEKADYLKQTAKLNAMMGKPAMNEQQIAALVESNKNMCKEAADILGKIGDARAVKPLISLLRDDDISVRSKAVDALSTIGISAVEPLITKLDRDKYVHSYEGTILVKIGAPAVKSLIAALANSNKIIRRQSIKVLGKIGDIRAIESLIAALKDSQDDMRDVAAEALGNIGKPDAVEPLIIILRDSEDGVRYAVAEALGKIGNAHAVKPLIAVFTDDKNIRVRRVAAQALVNLYGNGQLGEADKSQILVNRNLIITPRVDYYDCQMGQHNDTGIGVDFPL